MKYIAQESLIFCLFVTVLLFFGTEPAPGIVLHPDGEPNLTTWTDRPDPNVVGRWSSNASCIAVSGNCIITARHQGGGVASSVQIGGNTYIVTGVWNHSAADLRVAKLYGANLTAFVGLYEDTNEVGKDMVIGGYGRGRDEELIGGTPPRVYGYTWGTRVNDTLRWCTNEVDGNDIFAGGGYSSEAITGDFDGPGYSSSTTYEGIPSEYDSGGGWFIKDVNDWKVAAVTRGVTAHGEPWPQNGESWFRYGPNPKIILPDSMDGVRISSYATWISQTVPRYVPGDLKENDWVDFADVAVLGQYWLRIDCGYPDWCGGADFEPDGDVDWDDLAFLLDNWLSDGGI